MLKPYLHFIAIVGALLSPLTFAETQNSISLTVPSFTPGTSGAFSSTQVSGSAAAGSGTVTYTYAGPVQIAMTSGTGRYASLGSITRMGVAYDSFILFQSFISNNYLTVSSSNSSCPSATDYTWLGIRYRTPELVRNPNNMTSTTFYPGGTISYNPAAGTLFTGTNYFDMNGPTLISNPTYGFNGLSGASCSSGAMKLQATGTDYPMLQYGSVYFGNHGFVFTDYTGNPEVIVGLPKQTLTTNMMSGLANDVFSGRQIFYSSYTTQEQKNIYFVPDASGTTFTIKQATDLTDTTQQSTIGTLACTSLNTPTDGFCSGTLSLVGVTGTGKAVCHFYTGSEEHVVACSAQYPSNKPYPISFILSTPKQSLLTVALSGAAQTANTSSTATVTATLTNRTGRPITSMANPSASTSCPGTQDRALCAPFTNAGAFGGSSSTGGACGTTLAGYGTCTVTLTYTPSAIGSTLQTYRVAYNNGTGTVNATAKLVGSAALTSIAVTPTTATYLPGGTQQMTATATYSDASTQDVTSAVTWSTNNASSSISTSGLASWVSEGSTVITATLGATSGTRSTAVTAVPILTSAISYSYPDYVVVGSSAYQDFDNTNTNSDTGMTYACVFDRVVDGAVTGTACTSLPGTVEFDTGTGILTWSPDYSAFGPYEIKVTGTNLAGSGSSIFVVNVRPTFNTFLLAGDWDAQFANGGAKPHSSPDNIWTDISSSYADGTTNSTSHVTWSGNGTYSAPYTSVFDGAGYIDFGSGVLAGQTKMLFNSWIKSSNVSSNSDAVILGNSSNATGNGFTLRQHASYRDAVMADSPILYWRLGEATGATTATDTSATGNNGTYSSVTLAQTGALAADSDKASSFNGSSSYLYSASNSGITNNSAATIEAWFKLNDTTTQGTIVSFGANGTGTAFAMIANYRGAGIVSLETGGNYGAYTAGTLTAGTWNHVVISKPAGALSTTNIYINGVLWPLTAYSAGTPSYAAGKIVVGKFADYSGYYANAVIDEAAVYNTTLTAAQVAAHYKAGVIGKKLDFVIGQSYQDVVMQDSPTAYWRLGETSGTTVLDLGSGNHNGKIVVAPTLGVTGAVAGDGNKAMTFAAGSGHYISTTQTSSSTFTWEAWIKPTGDASGWHTIMSMVNTNYVLFDYTSTRIGVWTADGLGPATFNTTGNLTANVWHHVVLVREGNSTTNGYKLYLNGSLSGQANSGTLSPTDPIFLGVRSGVGDYYDGSLDEVATYSTALSSTRILAHYNAGLGTYGATCQSTSGLSDNLWTSVSGLYTNGYATLSVNGISECTVAATGNLSSAASNLFAGATDSNTKNFTGSIAEIKLHATNAGWAVGALTDVVDTFNATADKFRETPVGNLVRTNLTLNFDAANAKQGLRPFSNGCASTDLSWTDLWYNVLTLTNISSCGTSTGWNGDGTTTISGAAGPYRLNFDGTNDRVAIAASSLGDYVTVTGWFYFSAGSNIRTLFATSAGGYTTSGLRIYANTFNTSDRALFIETGNGSSGANANTSSGAYSNSTWTHLAFTINRSTGVGKIYVNDTSVETGTTVRTDFGDNSQFSLGALTDASYPFIGAMSSVQVYKAILTQAQIAQNCNAQKARFSGATCN